MNKIVEAALASNKYEKNNSELKKEYIKENIKLINTIMSLIPGFKGSFGTGYPFYALKSDLSGDLPIIEEQFRYNNELYEEGKDELNWVCEECLCNQGKNMPDLKQFCKPCPKIKDTIKPRKVINRMPDIDMWMICDDDYIKEAQNLMIKLFDLYNIQTSDVNPIKTIEDVKKIADDLENGIMPKNKLPLDIHIIRESEFSTLLETMPYVLVESLNNGVKPYLPIHPLSLRKTWQYDDEAYNFVLDYFLSLTPFNWEEKLMYKYDLTKQFITSAFNDETLHEVLDQVSPDSLKRRMQTMQLRKNYESRIDSWRK